MSWRASRSTRWNRQRWDRSTRATQDGGKGWGRRHIEIMGLHEVDGTDSTAELDGHWEVFQVVQVCEDFDGSF